MGFGLHKSDPTNLAERFWESRPEGVKAPYAKEEEALQDPEYIGTRGTLMEGAETTP